MTPEDEAAALAEFTGVGTHTHRESRVPLVSLITAVVALMVAVALLAGFVDYRANMRDEQRAADLAAERDRAAVLERERDWFEERINAQTRVLCLAVEDFLDGARSEHGRRILLEAYTDLGCDTLPPPPPMVQGTDLPTSEG